MKGTRFINELLKILSFKANGSFWAQKWCCAHSKFFFKKNLHNQKDKKVHEGFMEQWAEG